MSEEMQKEKMESAKKIELKIVEPRFDKNFMVAFSANTEEECIAYNSAIKSVLNEAGLSPFHQVGITATGSNNPGYHAWEIWKNASVEKIKSLLPLIEQEAKKFLERL